MHDDVPGANDAFPPDVRRHQTDVLRNMICGFSEYLQISQDGVGRFRVFPELAEAHFLRVADGCRGGFSAGVFAVSCRGHNLIEASRRFVLTFCESTFL